MAELQNPYDLYKYGSSRLSQMQHLVDYTQRAVREFEVGGSILTEDQTPDLRKLHNMHFQLLLDFLEVVRTAPQKRVPWQYIPGYKKPGRKRKERG